MKAVLVATLLLGGCSVFGGTGAGGGDTPQAQCARQANESPQVQEMMRIGAGTSSYLWDNQTKLEQARRDATLACLRARGLAPKGGVERPQS